MDCKLTFVVILAIFANANVKVDAVAGPPTVDAILSGADTLTGIVQKLDQTFVKPIVSFIETEIKKIDTNLKGITDKERELVEGALLKLAVGTNQIIGVRHVLSSLADTTITQSNSVKKILNVMLKSQANKAAKGLKFMAIRMKQIVERADTLLTEALVKYDEVTTNCATAKVKLNLFADNIVRLSSEYSKEHKAAVEKIRIEAYASAAGVGLIGGPLGVAIGTGVAAAVVEPKIKLWKEKLAKLKRQAEITRQNVIATVTKVGDVQKVLQTESGLVRQWQTKNKDMVLEYSSVQDFLDFMEWDDDMKRDHINKLDDLIKICKAFQAHMDDNKLAA